MAPTWVTWRCLGASLAHLGCKMSSKPASQSYIFSNHFPGFQQISRETLKNLPKWAPDASKCLKNGPRMIAKLNKKQTATNKKASTRASEQQSNPSQAKAKDKPSQSLRETVLFFQEQFCPSRNSCILPETVLCFQKHILSFRNSWGLLLVVGVFS